MVIVIAVVVLVVVVAAAAPFLDRAAAARAEQRASAYLTEPFGGPADVRVVRRPFLSQVARGRYHQIDVAGHDLRLGELRGASLVAHLSNVYLPVRELLGRRTREIVCERVQGRVVLPYDELARLAPVPGLTLRFGGERLTAAAAVPVPGLNQIVRVRGEAVLTHAGEGRVWLRIDQVSLVGIAIPSVLWNQLLPTLNFPIALPELPYGLRIDELRPTASGLVVDGSADAVVFRRFAEWTPRPEWWDDRPDGWVTVGGNRRSRAARLELMAFSRRIGVTDAGRPPVSPLLTSRRTVDFCRVRSCLCRAA